MNSKLRQNLLRYQNEISIIGSAVVLFALWSFIKMLAAYVLNKEHFRYFMEGNTKAGIIDLFFTVFFMALFFGIDLCIRVYVGNSAKAESRGNRKNGKKIGNKYIILSILIIFTNIVTLVSFIISQKSEFTGYIDIGVTIIVELTSTITLVEMVRAAFKIRHLRKEIIRLNDNRDRISEVKRLQ